jgi:hypothetical protein
MSRRRTIALLGICVVGVFVTLAILFRSEPSNERRCAFVAPYDGPPDRITTAIAQCAASGGGVVVLGGGTFNLSSGLVFPGDSPNGVTLRGMGANKTKILVDESGPELRLKAK